MKSIFFLLTAVLLSNIAISRDKDNIIHIELWHKGDFVNANLIVEDELGRRTGYDPVSKISYSEIPNAGCGNEGHVSTVVEVFHMRPSTTGIYFIKAFGWKMGSYNLLIATGRENSKGKDFHYKGVIDSGSISNYQLNYTTNPDSEIVAEKVVDSCSDIRQDLKICYKIGWITHKGIYNSLSKKIDNAEKQADKGKSKTAINNLNAFINEVEAQRDKHITEDAAVILVEDAEALIRKW